ncbi:Prefoldin [Cladochytrium replicatum]|nr:Prefoldin [Cladochytrium replicatum]
MSINDETLRKLLVETQVKLGEFSRQLQLVKSQQQARERERRLNELTVKELSVLDSTAKTYKSVGRMFLLTDVTVLTKNLQTQINDADKEIKALERAGNKIQSDLKDTQAAVRDLFGGQ